MRYQITKEFWFSASHVLDGLPPTHPCARLHGHNYGVTLELAADALNELGFVRDYRELDVFKRYLDETFDHRHLNDVIAGNPTAERLAEHFYDWAKPRFPELRAVSVSETAKTTATFRPAP